MSIITKNAQVIRDVDILGRMSLGLVRCQHHDPRPGPGTSDGTAERPRPAPGCGPSGRWPRWECPVPARRRAGGCRPANRITNSPPFSRRPRRQAPSRPVTSCSAYPWRRRRSRTGGRNFPREAGCVQARNPAVLPAGGCGMICVLASAGISRTGVFAEQIGNVFSVFAAVRSGWRAAARPTAWRFVLLPYVSGREGCSPRSQQATAFR